jgi:membrane protein insertase Oxa1/YidC/SpoIIIJ
MHTDLVVSKGQMHWWFGMDLSSYPFNHHGTNQALLTIPYLVLIGAAMFLQYYQMKQMNSRNPQAAAANPQMQTMQKFFPIIFGFIYLRVPAGATIYMVVSSAMRIGTQEVMFKTGMVEPVAVEREIGSGKQDKPPPAPKPEPKPSKRSTATDGTALAKGTEPPKKADTNGRPNTDANGRKPAARKRPANGKAAAAQEPPAPKPRNRSRSKRARKAR